jgi:hypothetical protein
VKARWFFGPRGVWHMLGGCGLTNVGAKALWDRPTKFGPADVMKVPRCCRKCVAAETREWTAPDRRVSL